MYSNMHLSIVIITLNNQRTIKEVLTAVFGWANEIVVVDSGSSDKTLEIAKEFGCSISYRKFDGFGKQKNFAVNQATNDWVFVVDADEVVTPELKNEISHALIKSDYQGFMIPNTLVFLGRIMRFGREYKLPHLRLFNRKFGNYNDNEVHEDILVEGKIGALSNHVLHFSYADISDVLEKTNKYTTLGAIDLKKRGKNASIFKIITKFPITFITEYLLRLNFLNGFEGFIWSFLGGVGTALKYLKLRELNKK
jgi:glycosyltransferase involved in cell wall biosynthesis